MQRSGLRRQSRAFTHADRGVADVMREVVFRQSVSFSWRAAGHEETEG